jgi:hypothetical protein
VIEAIVSKYVRYYTDSLELGFTPESAELNSENKVLVYLVALLGWRYVIESPPVISTKPADLEKPLGIAGGTLRPLLKNLKDAHLIAPSAEGYTVREGNLEAISAAINGEKKPSRRTVTAAPSRARCFWINPSYAFRISATTGASIFDARLRSRSSRTVAKLQQRSMPRPLFHPQIFSVASLGLAAPP